MKRREMHGSGVADVSTTLGDASAQIMRARPIGVRQSDRTVDDIPTGSWLVKPRDIPHAMWNVTDRPARVLEVVMPGGLEQCFEQIAPVLTEHGPEWTRRYSELAEAYGLTILDDWTDELKTKYGITL